MSKDKTPLKDIIYFDDQCSALEAKTEKNTIRSDAALKEFEILEDEIYKSYDNKILKWNEFIYLLDRTWTKQSSLRNQIDGTERLSNAKKTLSEIKNLQKDLAAAIKNNNMTKAEEHLKKAKLKAISLYGKDQYKYTLMQEMLALRDNKKEILAKLKQTLEKLSQNAQRPTKLGRFVDATSKYWNNSKLNKKLKQIKTKFDNLRKKDKSATKTTQSANQKNPSGSIHL